MLRRRMMLAAAGSSKLPAGYTKLEYLESDGTKWIDTGFVPNANTRVVADMLIVRNNTEQAANEFFGARTSASSLAYALQYNANSGNMQLFYWNGYTTLADSFPSSRVVYDLDKNVLSYDGKSISRTYGSGWECQYPMYIFALNNAGTATFMSIARLYSFQIYDNGTLVRDFIPAMNASGEAGLYDLKNDVWYGFKKPQVENKITIVEYRYEDEPFRQYDCALRAQYPLASDISIKCNVAAADADARPPSWQQTFNMKKGALESAILCSAMYNDNIDLVMGELLGRIISISPTEDDTYIYTF